VSGGCSRASGCTQEKAAKKQHHHHHSKSSVRARPGRLSALGVSHSKSGLYGAFLWRAGRLNTNNGGFRPGQTGSTLDPAVPAPPPELPVGEAEDNDDVMVLGDDVEVCQRTVTLDARRLVYPEFHRVGPN
jgi:hypothetical protein